MVTLVNDMAITGTNFVLGGQELWEVWVASGGLVLHMAALLTILEEADSECE